MEEGDAAPSSDAAFAVVLDVAASWHDYCRTRHDEAGREVPGLIVHAAGMTSEGFRTIDVWSSRSAWQRSRREVESLVDGLLAQPVVRELEVTHLICPAAHDRTEESRQ